MNVESTLAQLLILKGLTGEQRQKILEIGEIKQYEYGEHLFDRKINRIQAPGFIRNRKTNIPIIIPSPWL